MTRHQQMCERLLLALLVLAVAAQVQGEQMRYARNNELTPLSNCSYVPQTNGEQIQCGTKRYQEDMGPELLTGSVWADVLVCCCLVLMGGLMSGLTIGLMSMEPMNLKILAKSAPDPQNRVYAKRILPLVKRHHLLLVTLLLSNAVCMEALPLFVDDLLGPVGAIVISTTMVLVFGEIIPQAICSRFGLAIGANTYWFVWVLIALLSPVAWPISLLLDCLLGQNEEEGLYRRAELKELVGYHSIGGVSDSDSDDEAGHRRGADAVADESGASSTLRRFFSSGGGGGADGSGESAAHDDYGDGQVTRHSDEAADKRTSDTSKRLRGMGHEEKLSKDEVRIIKGALDLRDKTVQGSMTPIGQVFSLPISSRLDEETLGKIFAAGHSRVPIWRENEDDIIGMIHIKQLILLSPHNPLPLASLHIHRTPMVPAGMSLFTLLGIFQTGRSHLAIVIDPRDHITPIGIITLEDVIEELIQGEILDESDRFRRPPALLPSPAAAAAAAPATPASFDAPATATRATRSRSYSTSNHPFLSASYTMTTSDGQQPAIDPSSTIFSLPSPPVNPSSPRSSSSSSSFSSSPPNSDN